MRLNQKMKLKSPKMELLDMMAQACYYAQEHIDDRSAWLPENREYLLQCTSFQIACFLSQNTVEGNKGVESDIVLNYLAQKIKSMNLWKKILNRIVKQLGGWK